PQHRPVGAPGDDQSRLGAAGLRTEPGDLLHTDLTLALRARRGLRPRHSRSIQPLTVKRESRNCFEGTCTGITSCMMAAWKNTMLLCRGSINWNESVAASFPLRIMSS